MFGMSRTRRRLFPNIKNGQRKVEGSVGTTLSRATVTCVDIQSHAVRAGGKVTAL